VLTARPAEASDEQRLLAWRNEPTVRASAFETEPIDADTHHRWFTGKLADPRTRILILERDGEAVGQVRIDAGDDEFGEIDIAIAADWRGQGIGQAALELARDLAGSELQLRGLRARIKSSNAASLAAFTAAGFRVVGEGDGVTEMEADASV
jgi:RimJ/RimL family protein N-acetyltransferase